MANFKSWKIYMLSLIDQLVDQHGLTGPFLDAGCGSGDVSIHFARKGWSGSAVDFSDGALDETRKVLSPYPQVVVTHGDLFHLETSPAGTIFLMDVIEHVKDDERFLQSLGRNLSPGGHLVITAPVDPTEWRWDDDFYGHYRRYRRPDLRAMLERNGFQVLSEWDCSFPLFWFMRRVYTRLFPKRMVAEGTPEDRTKVSTQQSAWGGSRISGWIDLFFETTGLYRAHYPFRKGPWGCEVLLVARKKSTS